MFCLREPKRRPIWKCSTDLQISLWRICLSLYELTANAWMQVYLDVGLCQQNKQNRSLGENAFCSQPEQLGRIVVGNLIFGFSSILKDRDCNFGEHSLWISIASAGTAIHSLDCCKLPLTRRKLLQQIIDCWLLALDSFSQLAIWLQDYMEISYHQLCKTSWSL